MKLTKTKMREFNQKAEYHFFDKDTMSFFDSKIETKPTDPYFLFITSEKTGFDSDERAFTVRQFDPITYEVNDISDFLQFTTLKGAKNQIKRIKMDYNADLDQFTGEDLKTLKANL